MSDNNVEKTFLYLLAASTLLHLAIFGLIVLFPPEKGMPAPEPTMVDLTELPEAQPTPPSPRRERQRITDREQRVTRETAPKGTRETEQLRQQPARPSLTNRAEARPAASPSPPSQQPSRIPQETPTPVTRGEGLFKPKTGTPPDRATLFPSTGKLARLEEDYRKKYEPEVEDGETKFLNTDDIQFGSFLRRFETAVYGNWNYPQAALVRGIQGVTPVKITFSRGGEILHVELLETSGSRILDDEVLRTLKALGPIGSFPKGYTGQEFKLIAFFQYGIGGGRLH